MKKLVFTLSFTGMTFLCAAQINWNTNLNDIPASQEPKFGTLSDMPIDFYTNGSKKMTLGQDGALQLLSFENPDATDAVGRFVVVDKYGILRTTGGGGGVTSCSPTAAPWVLGGNYAAAGSNTIGTCGDVDFILKANNQPMLYMKTTTSKNYYGSTLMGIGPNNSNPLSQLDITDGVTATWAGRTIPDHLRIYGDYNGAIEATGAMNLMYKDNFTIGRGDIYNGFSSNLDINSAGDISMSGNVGITKKLRVGGTNLTNDMFSVSSNVSAPNALAIYNTAGGVRFRIFNDGKTHMGENVQIGFPGNASMIDPNYRLNIDASGSSNGIKLTTNSNTVNLISASNSNFSVSPFTVGGSGRTDIGTVASSPNTAQLNINTNSTNAIDVYDGAAVNFRVKATGFTYCRELQVMTGQFPDYVFDASYDLKTLSEVESYIQKNKHLPGFESADHYVENGIKTSEMFVKQQEKIEELTLYIIALEKRLQQVEKNSK